MCLKPTRYEVVYEDTKHESEMKESQEPFFESKELPGTATIGRVTLGITSVFSSQDCVTIIITRYV